MTHVLGDWEYGYNIRRPFTVSRQPISLILVDNFALYGPAAFDEQFNLPNCFKGSDSGDALRVLVTDIRCLADWT